MTSQYFTCFAIVLKQSLLIDVTIGLSEVIFNRNFEPRGILKNRSRIPSNNNLNIVYTVHLSLYIIDI